MRLSLFRLSFLFMLLLSGIVTQSSYAADAAQPAPQVSAAQAKRVLGVLQDPKKRTELEETLSVIAKATDAEAAPADTAPAEPAADKPIALQQNGVVAQVFARLERGFDSIGAELRLTARTALEFRSIGLWWDTHFGTDEARADSLQAIGSVIAILAAALAVEWVVQWLLRRPRQIVAEHAARKFALEESKRVAALPPATAAQTPDDIAAAADAPPDAAAPATGRLRYDKHWGVLRRTPYALAYAVLKWLPLLAFVGTSSLLIALWGGPSTAFYDSILPLVGAYAATRVTLCVIGVLFTPAGPGLRLAPISNDTALYLRNWIRRIVVVAVFGSALTEVALHLGATPDAQNALSKLVSLVVHLMLIVMVVQCRKPVAAWIRGQGSKREGITALRSLLADIWAPLAALMIVALWVVWALGVTNGFQQLLHYFAVTAAVVVAAVVIAILSLGALDKAFFSRQAQGDEPAPPLSPAAQHYQRLTQRAVTVLVVAIAALVMLEAWGIDALNWFRPGSIGRSIASATATIGVAFVLAIIAWETINLSINRRVERWTATGDTVRATRLRTLVPILRTTLFIVIAMVVLFTALNELGINIAPLLAGASILGVALGFGSQKLVQDFITGIFLLMENAMQVGDNVTVAGVSGAVEYLSIRTVRLRAGDGSLHVIPFSSVTTVTNTNRGIGNAAIRLSVRADSDVDAVIAAIKQVGAEMREDPKYKDAILADLDLWGVDQVDGATVTLAGQIRTTDRGRWSVQRGFNQLIWKRFRELGIQLNNPQEMLYANKTPPANTSATPQLVSAPAPDAPPKTV